MYTEDLLPPDDDSPVFPADVFLDRTGGSSGNAVPCFEAERLADPEAENVGSSNCPAGVSKKAPSGLKVSLRKKLV